MIKRIALTCTVVIGTLVVANFVLGEVAVFFEMLATGADTRAELSEDYGLGLLGVLVVFPVSGVLALACGWITWRILNKGAGGPNENA